MGLYFRAEQTFYDKKFESYTVFYKTLKIPTFDEVNKKCDEVVTKSCISHIVFFFFYDELTSLVKLGNYFTRYLAG